MALTISFMKNDGFWLVGETPEQDRRFVMDEVFLTRGFILREEDTGNRIEVGMERKDGGDIEEVEIADDVWVSDGHRSIVGKARCVFEAPRTVKILRDELYRELGRGSKAVA